MKIRLAADLQTDSIVDGEGIRTVVWTQGCPHKCPGCHNPQTHDFKAGVLVDVEEVVEEIKKLKGQDGITLSGGGLSHASGALTPNRSLDFANGVK